MMNGNHIVSFGETKIHFSLKCSKRKTLVIRVYPDGCVSVGAPLSVTEEQIYERVKNRAPWILKQQRKFETYPQPVRERKCVSGESYRYLGKQYRLKAIYDTKKHVKLTHDEILIYTPHIDNALVSKQLLKAFYKEKALDVFTERYIECLKRVEKLDIQHSTNFKIRTMRTRWGSCSSKGSITLNTELVAAPKECIDYVILHELCHLKEHNHGKGFYRLLDLVMNDWKLYKKQRNLICIGVV